MKKFGVMSVLTGASLLAVALALAPSAEAQRGNSAPSLSSRPVGSFTPAVSDPRLAAALARRRSSGGDMRFTPASAADNRERSVRVAIRARANTPAEAQRRVADSSSATPVTAITPISYNLGASVGWRSFAVSGDVAQTEGGAVPGTRESARVGVSYRADRRLSGRVALAAERAEGAQRIVGEDEAYSLDVGGSYSIARNVDVTAGARYRISRDRLEPLARDDRRDSQAVYIGTAFRF